MKQAGTNSLAARWRKYRSQPFPMLVGLFMQRILNGNSGGEDELNLSLGLVLTLLAIPGGFISLFLFDKYGSLLRWLRGLPRFDTLAAALPDEYFFIVLSMTVTGGVALWWWDSIFPDRRDFENLAPLPISTSRIFLANAAALLLLACLFAADVNAASCILYPAVLGAAQPSLAFVVRFGLVHGMVVMLASAFGFFAVFALVGTLLLILPYALFRRISLYIRGLIVVGLLAALATSFAVPARVLHLETYRSLRFLPPVWFLALCQLLRNRADPALARLGRFAPFALVSICALAAAAYALSYRRCFVRLPELANAPQGQMGGRSAWLFRALDGWLLRTPLERAEYRFALKTLFRNEAHALALGGFAALGVVIAAGGLFAALDGKGAGALPSPRVLAIPLMLSYCLLAGLRMIFNMPANLGANWTFRFLIDRSGDAIAPARRVMLSFVLPWLLGIAFPIYLHFWGWRVALLHTTVVVAWSALLAEALLVRFRKVPFTCGYPPFQHSGVVAVIVYVLGFLAFSGITSEMEFDMLRNPLHGVALVVIGLIAWGIIRWARSGVGGEIVFEDIPDAGFEVLHLTDGS